MTELSTVSENGAELDTVLAVSEPPGKDHPETSARPTVWGRKRHSKGPKRNRKRLRLNEEPLFGRDTGYVCSHCHGIFWGPLIRENLGVWKFCPACGSAFSEISQVSYSELSLLPEEALSERMNEFKVDVISTNETENQLLRKLQKKYNNSRFCDVCGHSGVEIHCSECPSSFHKSCMGILGNYPLSHRWKCNACIHQAHEKQEKHVLAATQTCRGPWKLPEVALQCCSCGYHEIESITCDACDRSFCFACMCLSVATVPPNFWYCPECIGQERYDDMLKENIAKSREGLEGNDISSKGQDCFSQLVFDLLCACAWEEWYRNIEPLVRHVFHQLEKGEVPVIMPFHALHYTSSGVSFDKGMIRRIAEAYARDAKEKALKLIKQKPNKDEDENYHAWKDDKIVLNPSENGIRRLRIGYISSDFVDHPTADLIQSALLLHDDSKFEIFCYSITRDDDNSHYRKTIAQDIEHFRNFPQRDNDKKCAEAIAEDGIHILVNLNGHTAGDRNGISALRPAPVQLVYLAYPGTMGADYIDFNVADRTVCPANHREFYTERVLHMPYCYQTNSFRHLYPEILDPSILPTRDDHQLPDHPTVVFCNFCRLGRITSDLFRTWMNILRRVPNSVIWLYKHPKAAVPRLQLQAKRSGIPPERLVFGPPCSPKIEHLKRVTLADLCLDTIVYNGHTTASDMLWAGVPFVTVSGDNWPSLVATCIAKSVGMPEMAVSSLAEYEDLAVKLGNDPAMLREWKTKLKANRLTAPLFDPERWIRSFESGLEKIWDFYERKVQFPMDVECTDFGKSEAAEQGIVGKIRGIANFEQRKHFANRCDISKPSLDPGMKKKLAKASFKLNRKRKELKRLHPYSKKIRENSVMIAKRTKVANSKIKLDRFSKLKKHRKQALPTESGELQGKSEKHDPQDGSAEAADFVFLEAEQEIDFGSTHRRQLNTEDVVDARRDSESRLVVETSVGEEASGTFSLENQSQAGGKPDLGKTEIHEHALVNCVKQGVCADENQTGKQKKVSFIETKTNEHMSSAQNEISHALPNTHKDAISTAMITNGGKTENHHDQISPTLNSNSKPHEPAKVFGNSGVMIHNSNPTPSIAAEGSLHRDGVCAGKPRQGKGRKKRGSKAQDLPSEGSTDPQGGLLHGSLANQTKSGISLNQSSSTRGYGRDMQTLQSNVDAMTRFLSQSESQQHSHSLGIKKEATEVLQRCIKEENSSLLVTCNSTKTEGEALQTTSTHQTIQCVNIYPGCQGSNLAAVRPGRYPATCKGNGEDAKEGQHLTTTPVQEPAASFEHPNGHPQVQSLLSHHQHVGASPARHPPQKHRKPGGSKGGGVDPRAVGAGFPCHPQPPESYVVDLLAPKRSAKQGKGIRNRDGSLTEPYAPLIYPNSAANARAMMFATSTPSVQQLPATSGSQVLANEDAQGVYAEPTSHVLLPASPGVDSGGSRHNSTNSSASSQEGEFAPSILVPLGIPRTVMPPALPRQEIAECRPASQGGKGGSVFKEGSMEEWVKYLIKKVVMMELESHKHTCSANDSLQKHLERVESEALKKVEALIKFIPPFQPSQSQEYIEALHYNQVRGHVREISKSIAPQCIWLSKEMDLEEDL